MEFLNTYQLKYYYSLIKNENHILFKLIDLEKQNIKNEQDFYKIIWRLIKYSMENYISDKDFLIKLISYYRPPMTDEMKHELLNIFFINTDDYNNITFDCLYDLKIIDRKLVLNNKEYNKECNIFNRKEINLYIGLDIYNKNLFIKQIMNDGFSAADAKRIYHL